MIEIDGSHGEGGGQILRTALTLSSITGKPFRIFNIRKGRDKPGLMPQHLAAVRSTRKVCRGGINGDEIGSTSIAFSPGKIVAGKYDFDIGTAGSTLLVLQTIMPILLSADKKSEIEITGGTFNKKAPSYDHFEAVFVKVLNFIGYKITTALIRPGYYPSGGGKIKLTTEPSKFQQFDFLPTEEHVKGIIRVSNLEMSVAYREKKVFVERGLEDVKIIEERAFDPGNIVFAYKGFRGIDVLGEKGKRAELVAKECIDMLEQEKGEVDRFTADQLMVYAALAPGSTYTTSVVTEHMKTNASIIGKFLDVKFSFLDEKEACRIKAEKI